MPLSSPTQPKLSKSARPGAPQVLVLGELLCDLFVASPGQTLVDTPALIPHLGGAPANVAVQLARLGTSVSLLSAVGKDAIGCRMLAELETEGVDVAQVVRLADRKTGLTLVEVDATGERSFHPRRDQSADLAFGMEHLNETALKTAPLLHTGTVSLRSASARQATRHAILVVREAGGVISLDVNLRFAMFPNRSKLLSLARGAVARAHIVKATLEEASALYGATDVDTLLERIHAQGPVLVFLTLDQNGAWVSHRSHDHQHRQHVPTQPATLVDATGAGDAFVGATLHALLTFCQRSPEGRLSVNTLTNLDATALTEITVAAHLAGAAAVTAMGATTAMRRAETSHSTSVTISDPH